eukprot:RCo024248
MMMPVHARAVLRLWLVMSLAQQLVLHAGAVPVAPPMYAPGKAAVFMKDREVVCTKTFSFGNNGTWDIKGATFMFWAFGRDPFSSSTIISIASSDPKATNDSNTSGGDNFLQMQAETLYMFDVNNGNYPHVYLADGKWHHYALSLNDTDRRATWMVDGQYWANLTYPTQRYNISSYRLFQLNLCVGNDQDGWFGGFSDGDAFVGSLDSLSIWTTPMGMDEVQALMAGTTPASVQSYLLVQWEFDDPSGVGYFKSVSGDPKWNLYRCSGYGTDCLTAVTKGGIVRSDGCVMVGQQPSRAPVYRPWNATAAMLVGFPDTGATAMNFTLRVVLGTSAASSVVLTLVTAPSLGSITAVGSSVAILAGAPLGSVTAEDPASSIVTGALTLTYVPTSGSVAADSFTVSAAWTASPTVATTITVTLYANLAPSVTVQQLDAKMNLDYSFMISADDPNLDNLEFVVTALPTRGSLLVYGADSPATSTPAKMPYAVVFRPVADTSNSYLYTQFTLVASDGMATSDPATYSVRVLPTNKLPVLAASMSTLQNFSVTEDTRFTFTIPYTDSDSLTTAVIVAGLPQSGTLSILNTTSGALIPVSLATAAQTIQQLTFEVVSVSSESPLLTDSGFLAYGKEVLLIPQTEVFKNPDTNSLDDTLCWYPSGSQSCDTLSTDFFYTEWVYVRFRTPVSPTFLHLFICQGGTFNVRVLVKKPSTGAWHDLSTLYTPSSSPAGVWVQEMELCQTTFLVTDVMVYIDNCFSQEWKGVDHLELQGFSATQANAFPPGTTFVYTPDLNYNGDASFQYVLSDCIGNSFHQTDAYTILFHVLPVNDIPVATAPAAVSAYNGRPVPIILQGTDVEGPPVTVTISTLPVKGVLTVGGIALTATSLRTFNLTAVSGSSLSAMMSISYQPSSLADCGADPVTVTVNNATVTLPYDTFNFTVTDNQGAVSLPVVVRIAEAICSVCVDGLVLVRGRCESCPVGFEWRPGGSCVVAEASKTSIIVAGAVAGGVGLLLLLAVLWVLYRRATKIKRAYNAAPGGSGYAVLMFTDIQSSTKLWENHEDAMKVALEMHNEAIRGLISEFNGYEVKTQGDSFMVSFDKCRDACRFALQMQLTLTDLPWPDDLLTNPNCKVEYNGETLIWAGVRVRVGIHFGPVERELDPNTQRIDYFGPTVNCAARVESLAYGGQVLCSKEVIAELGDSEEMEIEPMGSFPLKGIAGEKEIFQISHSSLPRKFEPIKKEAAMKQEVSADGTQACLKCNRPLKCKCTKDDSKAGGRGKGRGRAGETMSMVGSMISARFGRSTTVTSQSPRV